MVQLGSVGWSRAFPQQQSGREVRVTVVPTGDDL